jgi:4-amino-4-deoxy-L-arabinose transferase-like glycosyltransferase
VTEVPGGARGRAAAAAALLLALCGWTFFRGADRPGLVEKDEPRYAVPAREMVRSGDAIVPRFGGQERLEKPPGAYWAQAAAFAATGRFDERTARLPSAVAATLAVLLVAAGCGRSLGLRAGVAAGAAMATMLLAVVSARLATTDMLHALLFAAAAACWVPVLEGSPLPGRWILLSGAAAGAAALVKTPLALLLPPVAAAGTAFALGRLGGPGAVPAPFRRGARARTAAAWAGAVAVAAAAFAAWAIPCDAATEGRLLSELRLEILARADPGKGLHVEPPWFFEGVVLAGALPWTFLLPAGAAAAARAARGSGPARVLGVYAAVLAAAVLLFFSALPSKLANYVLPMAPCLAVLAGYAVDAGTGPGTPPWARRVAGWGTLSAGVLVALVPLLPPVRAVAGAEPLRDLAPALAATGALLGIAGAALLAGRIGPAAIAAGASVAACLLLAEPVLPHLERDRCARGVAEAMVRAGLRPGDRVVDASNQVTGIPWYADCAVETRPGGRSFRLRQVSEVLASPRRAWAVVRHDPGEGRRRGRATPWEEVRRRLPAEATVRVAWEGWGRVIVTNTPEGPAPPTDR